MGFDCTSINEPNLALVIASCREMKTSSYLHRIKDIFFSLYVRFFASSLLSSLNEYFKDIIMASSCCWCCSCSCCYRLNWGHGRLRLTFTRILIRKSNRDKHFCTDFVFAKCFSVWKLNSQNAFLCENCFRKMLLCVEIDFAKCHQ